MDNVAHSLLGLMLSRAGLNRLSPYASAITVIAANMPDSDLVVSLSSGAAYLDNHRAWTHSVFLSPVMAAIPVIALGLLGKKKIRWAGALLAAWIGVLSHLFLDWTNTYGTRLLLPFSEERLRLDLNNVYDYWFWTVLLLAWLSPMLGRLVGSEIGAKNTGPGRGWPIFALALLTCYEGTRYFLHERAVTAVDSRMYGGNAPIRSAAIPHAGNPFLWDAVVETSAAMGRQTFDVRQEYDPLPMKLYPKPDASPLVDAAKQTRPVASFLRFSAFPLWQIVPVDEPKGGSQVNICDLRFGEPQQGRFCAEAILDQQARVVSSRFAF